MDGKYIIIIFILMVVGVSAKIFSVYYVTKYQMSNAKTSYACGYFEKYDVKNESSSGKIDVLVTYIYIKDNSGKNFKFEYQGRLHEKISYIKTDLKKGQKLCFEYFTPFFKYEFGETFLKSVYINRNI